MKCPRARRPAPFASVIWWCRGEDERCAAPRKTDFPSRLIRTSAIPRQRVSRGVVVAAARQGQVLCVYVLQAVC